MMLFVSNQVSAVYISIYVEHKGATYFTLFYTVKERQGCSRKNVLERDLWIGKFSNKEFSKSGQIQSVLDTHTGVSGFLNEIIKFSNMLNLSLIHI